MPKALANASIDCYHDRYAELSTIPAPSFVQVRSSCVPEHSMVPFLVFK